MVRLFVAVWPPEELVEDLRALPRKDRRGVSWVAPDKWHTTLRFLGDAQPEAVADRLGRVELPPAVARYGPGVDVLWDRVVAVPVAGLRELAAAVSGATADLGTAAPRRRFVGHLTLARLARRARVPAVIGFPVRAEDDVAEIALVASRLRPSGAVYETLATWPITRETSV